MMPFSMINVSVPSKIKTRFLKVPGDINKIIDQNHGIDVVGSLVENNKQIVKHVLDSFATLFQSRKS